MYGKIFEQIYDGTLADNWQAMITFQQMIILCDDQGVIDMTPSAISRRTGIPLEHIELGIECLEKEDPHSRTPDEDGKRIVRMDSARPWGWYIVNHKKYRQMVRYKEKKEADRMRIAAKRSGESLSVAVCSVESQPVADVAHTNTDTNTDTKKRYSANFLLFWEKYPVKKGKAAAFKKWKTLNRQGDLPPLDVVLKAVSLQVSEKEALRISKQFCPEWKHPATWLNQQCWEDEPTPISEPQDERTGDKPILSHEDIYSE